MPTALSTLRSITHRSALAASFQRRAPATPPPLSSYVVRYAVEARRAGRLPEEMIIDLKALHADARRERSSMALWSATTLPSDELLSQMISVAIRAYFIDEEAL